MKVVRESEVRKDLLDQFIAVANEGRQLLGKAEGGDAAEWIAAMDGYVSQSGLDLDGTDLWTERALPIGTLWGELCIRELGWEWVKVHFEDGSSAIGVFSKDRSIGIYPWYFVLGCVENGAPVTIELAWNMLRGGAIPKLDRNSYTNLMDGVHHIVPSG